MTKRLAIALTTAMTGATMAATPAHATAFGIKAVVIQVATTNWLQVAEVQALNTIGTNVAATANGGVATSSGQYSGTGYLVRSGAGNTINGTIGGNYFSGTASQWIFHSDSTSTSEFLKITFASVQDLQSLSIYGRTDCCATRDVYKITLLDASNGVVATFNNQSANNAAHRAALTFSSTYGVPPIPEPATWMNLMAGFGALGSFLRRPNRKIAMRCRFA